MSLDKTPQPSNLFGTRRKELVLFNTWSAGVYLIIIYFILLNIQGRFSMHICLSFLTLWRKNSRIGGFGSLLKNTQLGIAGAVFGMFGVWNHILSSVHLEFCLLNSPYPLDTILIVFSSWDNLKKQFAILCICFPLASIIRRRKQQSCS